MRIVSFNANGIRSAAKKGFFSWLHNTQPDMVCIQETRAQLAQLKVDAQFFPAGYHCYYHDAEKKGYSGVAIYSRYLPDEVIFGIKNPLFDHEGRCVELKIGALSIISLYLPSGSSGDERQQFKLACLDYLKPRLQQMMDSGRDYIICGDWNIAHKPIDLKNWKGNLKNSGFLPEERAWLDKLQECGWVDAFRVINPMPEQYTWWSNRGQAWAKNVGWRIDYQWVTPQMGQRVVGADIYKLERFSDHAPLTLDYDYSIAIK